jgi:hypothetical protein
MTSDSNAQDQIPGGCLVASFVVATVIWLSYVIAYAPKQPASDQTLPKDCQLYTEWFSAYPNIWPRVELMKAQNLDIFVARHEFETVPFPDRKGVILRIGKSWGKYTEWYNFSSVRIRDIRSGEVLANYSCNRDNVTLASE